LKIFKNIILLKVVVVAVAVIVIDAKNQVILHVIVLNPIHAVVQINKVVMMTIR